MKAWQLITHLCSSPTYKRLKKIPSYLDLEECGAFRPTPSVAEAMRYTLECARALRASHIVFQCPARFTPDEENVENLRNFFRTFPARAPLRYCWEPRGAWPEALIEELCAELGLIHVVDPFDRVPVSQGPRYYRIHVGKRGRYSYTDQELKDLVKTVQGDEDTHVLFNNTEMLKDAARFREMLNRARGTRANKSVAKEVGQSKLRRLAASAAVATKRC
jgi:uncharacterized protein YecE (DUF72 family)